MKPSPSTLLPFLALSLMANVSALEPLEDSTKLLMKRQAAKVLAKSDKNKDGKIQKEEDERFWKRNARHDKNRDGALDLEELKQVGDPPIDSAGEKLLNIIFKRTPQGPVFLDFYFPEEDAGSDKPVVIFTHGGGWAAGNKSKAGTGSFNEVHKALLKEGFCVLSVGYRKVGKNGDTAMRDCVIDSKDALRFISAHRKELGIDPNKIHAFGDSAGGQLAQMIALSPSGTLTGDEELAEFDYEVVSGVSWYGPCDFQNQQLFNHDDRPGFRDRFGPRIMGSDAKPEEKEQRYREMSPVSYLSKDSPPLLMIQGDKDTTIPVKQAYRMQEALKTIDAPVEVLIVKNAGHNWRSVEAPIEPTRAEIVERTIQFFLQHQ